MMKRYSNHDWYMEVVTKRIQEKNLLIPSEYPHHFDYTPFFNEGNPRYCNTASKFLPWLPSMVSYLIEIEWCSQLKATMSWALDDSNLDIQYVLDNELVAWFVLFLFTDLGTYHGTYHAPQDNLDNKEYAARSLERLCSETYDVATKMPTIDQTTYRDNLLQRVLTLTLEDNDKDNREVVRQACSAVAFLCGYNSLNLTFGAGVQNRLLELAKCDDSDLAWPAIHALCYIAMNDECMLQRIVKEELCFLFNLLDKKHGNHMMVLEATCCFVDVIVRGYKDGSEDDIVTSFIPPIVKLSSCGDSSVERAAVDAISSATIVASQIQIKKLVQLGCLKALCTHLNDAGADHGTCFLNNILDGIENILRAGDTRISIRNEFAKEMDECLGWSALEEVTDDCDITEARARKIAEEYYVDERYFWRRDDEQDQPSLKRRADMEDEQDHWYIDQDQPSPKGRAASTLMWG